MDFDIRAARAFAESAARDLGDRLREGFGVAQATDQKSARPNDIVTAFDVEAERRLVDALASFDAGIGVVGEEGGASGSTDTFWVIDPIDGTAHYARGLPFCTTMLGLIHDGVVVASVIYDFVRDHVYSAALGQGASCNGDSIRVSNRGLSQAYVCVEMDLQRNDNHHRLQRLAASTIVMSLINCGWDFAMTASGKVDGRIMVDPFGHVWDYAPGSLLVAEAGGVVTNHGVSTYDYRDHNFMAVAPAVYRDLAQGTGDGEPLFPVSEPG